METQNSGHAFSDAWHLKPNTCFTLSFVFINISGYTFIFGMEETKEGARDSQS